MCKTRSQSIDGIQNHVLDKHEIDSQYKCALCSYKTNEKDHFDEHFKEAHPNQEIDVIYAYRKVEDCPKDDIGDNFDTTPLWQRDRPRVRHIRGILFDESSPIPSKSPKKTNKSQINVSPVSGTTSKITQSLSEEPKNTVNLDLAIESVANGTADVLKAIEIEKPLSIVTQVCTFSCNFILLKKKLFNS